MAQSFDPSCPVLDFRPRGHTKPGPRNERAWILWPAWVYRVVCPKKGDRALNVFEEAVLGMLCVGNCTLQEIADALGLNAELVAHIAARELADRGYVEEGTLVPTPFGKQAVHGGMSRTAEKTVGFVFQDPWTGRLWPTFRDRLLFMDIDYSDQGYPDLLLGGSKGRPWRQHAFCLLPPADSVASIPSAEDILKAARSAMRAQQRVSSDLFSEEDDATHELEQQFESFKEVSFIDESPEPHFLVTYLYVPHDGSDDADWYACDPFGTGYSMSFKREVAERVRESTPLGNHVSKCLGLPPESGESIALGHERAEALIREAFENISVPPTVLPELVEFQLKLLQVESAEAARRQTFQLIREAFTQARRVIELLCELINEHHRDPAVRDVLYLDNCPRNAGALRDMVERINTEAVRRVGFASDGLRRITTTSASNLRDCADRKARGKIAGEFMLAVHTAARQDDHPFRTIASRDPAFLQGVERLMDLSHPAAHAGQIETQRLEELSSLTFGTARLILTSYSQGALT